MTTDTRKCTRCLDEKPMTEFNFKDKRRGRLQIYCRECSRELIRMHYEAHKDYYYRKNRKRKTRIVREQREWILSYLDLHPCTDCGEADPCCLDFDHVRGKKRIAVAQMIGNCSWETIETEINKCEVRCANCHRKRHAKLRKEWYSPTVITPP